MPIAYAPEDRRGGQPVMTDWALPPSLKRSAPLFVDTPAVRSAVEAVFAGADAGGFTVYLDNACGMPADWKSFTYSKRATGQFTGPDRRRDKSKADTMEAKYAAESLLPNMLTNAGFVTDDWRRANASVVVLYAQLFGGPVFGPQRCRRALAERSEAWRATGGRRHFFILTGDFGACSYDGFLIDPELLRHHVIATHGEIEGHHWHWGDGPNLPCFVPAKDISIPPANWLDAPNHTADAVEVQRKREMLAFFAGAGELRNGKRQGRQTMLRVWAKDPDIIARPRVTYGEMMRNVAGAKFCPIFGGNSPWSTRLVEVMMAGCVPVIFSSWLPPFSRVLDWKRFSVLVPSLDLVPDLKRILEQQPYEQLKANLPLALDALWFRTDSKYQGDDMLPFLLVEMYMAMKAAVTEPLDKRAERIIGLPVNLSYFYDDVLANRSSPLIEQLPPPVAAAVRMSKRLVPATYRGGVTIVTNRSYRHEQVWRCVPMAKNSHSYRETDPNDFRTEQPGLNDSRLKELKTFQCHRVVPQGSLRVAERLSPTQMPPNHTLVRQNRAYFLAGGFGGGEGGSKSKFSKSKAKSMANARSPLNHTLARQGRGHSRVGSLARSGSRHQHEAIIDRSAAPAT